MDAVFTIQYRASLKGVPLVVWTHLTGGIRSQNLGPAFLCTWNTKQFQCPMPDQPLQLRCAFHNDGRETHYSCPSFPEVHFDRDLSSSDLCAIVVNNIEDHHEGKYD